MKVYETQLVNWPATFYYWMKNWLKMITGQFAKEYSRGLEFV